MKTAQDISLRSACALLAISFVSVTYLTSCSNPEDESGNRNTTRISAAAILASAGTPVEKAEELGKAAEELLAADGFEQAYEMAKVALVQDDKNLRAGLVKHISAPLAIAKGGLARLRNLSEAHPLTQKRFERLNEKIEAKYTPALYKHLMNGPVQTHTEKEFQTYLDRLIKSLEELRKFAKANKESEISIRPHPLLAGNLFDRYVRGCEIKESAKLEYELTCPEPSTRFSVSLNRADFEAIQHAAAFQIFEFSVYATYNISGIQSVLRAHPTATQATQAIVDQLLTDAKFGTLRTRTHLARLKQMGLDMVNGLNWGLANKATLCPNRYDDPRPQRPGKMIDQGICVFPEFKSSIDTLEMAFKGEPVDTNFVKNGQALETQTNMLKFVENPVADFRQLGPIKVDQCGQLGDISDTTLRGVFPKGDANVVIGLGKLPCDQ